MKIKIVNYMEGEARFVVEGATSKSVNMTKGKTTTKESLVTFCIPLEGKTTKEEVIDELKAKLAKFPKPAPTEQTFNDLKLKDLEGTDI